VGRWVKTDNGQAYADAVNVPEPPTDVEASVDSIFQLVCFTIDIIIVCLADVGLGVESYERRRVWTIYRCHDWKRDSVVKIDDMVGFHNVVLFGTTLGVLTKGEISFNSIKVSI
jgi:hypothetical protein